jgi:hypothetical protein
MLTVTIYRQATLHCWNDVKATASRCIYSDLPDLLSLFVDSCLRDHERY